MSLDIIDDVRTQTAVYWAPTGLTDDYGQPKFASPVEFTPAVEPPGGVYWMGVVETFTAANGKDVVSKAKVMVGQDVEVDGVLWLGSLASLTTEQRAKPFLKKRAYQIRRFDSVPTIEGDQTYRVAYL